VRHYWSDILQRWVPLDESRPPRLVPHQPALWERRDDPEEPTNTDTPGLWPEATYNRDLFHKR
jgi:hypothetical protein